MENYVLKGVDINYPFGLKGNVLVWNEIFLNFQYYLVGEGLQIISKDYILANPNKFCTESEWKAMQWKVENKKVVTGCGDCPFNYCDAEAVNHYPFICSLKEDGKIEQDKNYDPITPSWCPLREGDVMISLVENKSDEQTTQ